MPSASSPTLHAYPSSVPSSQPSSCVDEEDWFYDYTPTGSKLGCGAVMNDPAKLCAKIGHFTYNRKTAYSACCACGKYMNTVSSASIFLRFENKV